RGRRYWRGSPRAQALRRQLRGCVLRYSRLAASSGRRLFSWPTRNFVIPRSAARRVSKDASAPSRRRRDRAICFRPVAAQYGPDIKPGRKKMTGSLAGVRVLELARYQAGPRGGMIMSDLGAEVIKIEKLGGEETRRSEPVVRGQSVYFAVYNRGKKSLCLDMRTPRGKEIFAALVPTADVVLENFRPGTMAQMGF